MSKKQNGKAMQNYREEIVQNTSVSEEALHNRKQKKHGCIICAEKSRLPDENRKAAVNVLPFIDRFLPGI